MSSDVRSGPAGGAGIAAPATDWSRIAALGGVLFFVMLLVAFFAPAGSPPSVDDSTKTITDWYVKHHTGIMIADFFQALAIFPFLFFVASLWRTVRWAEGSGLMTVVVAIGGAAGAALAIIAFAAESALTFQAAKLGDPALVRAFFDLNRIVLTYIWVPLAAMIAVTSLVTVRTKVLPSWIGWAGLVTAAVMLISTLGVFADKTNFIDFLGFIAFILFALWVLATSIVLYLRPPAAAISRVQTA